MDVLRFKHNNDYEIVIRTDSISRSWKRFCSRIDKNGNRNSLTYCRYTSTDNGMLELFNPDEEGVEGFGNLGYGTIWENKPPVLFETNKYSISIKFPKTDGKPKVKHAKKDVEDFFFYDKDSNGDGCKLTGDVSFLNEPGVFKLEFEYVIDGKRKNEIFTFEIESPKLDTKKDYKIILDSVNREYENIIFRYLSVTYQQFKEKGTANNDQIWIQVFEDIFDDYIKAVNRIINKPHFKTKTYTDYERADKIKKWTPQMEEKYWEYKQRGNNELERHFFSYKEYSTTINTLENRFVKYTVCKIGRRLFYIINNILKSDKNSEMSVSRRSTLKGYTKKLNNILNNDFFKTIGRFEGLKQESLILQNRSGYVQVYKDWIKLKRGIGLYIGATNISTLQIWEIYELWCFIKMKHLIREVLNIDEQDTEHVFDDKNTVLDFFSSSKVEHVVTFIYPEKFNREGDKVTLHYQHTFNRFKDDMHTATTEQRPDIVLNIHRKDDITLTYLYDAKYRVLDDEKNEGDRMNADYPVPEAINQMHRYRDAIYYGSNYKEHVSKEIIGGYILFPGRGNDESVSERYFSKSIEKVNIGAFPLIPDSIEKNEGSLLRKHLEKILIKNSKIQQITTAKPQRGLYYTTITPNSNDNILIGCVKSKAQKDWIMEHEWYNIRLMVHNHERPGAQISDINLMLVKHIVLYLYNEEAGHPEYIGCYDIKSNDLAPMFFDNNDMQRSEYPDNDNDSFFNRYLVYEIDTENDSCINIDINKMSEYISKSLDNSKEKGSPILVTVKDINDMIINA